MGGACGGETRSRVSEGGPSEPGQRREDEERAREEREREGRRTVEAEAWVAYERTAWMARRENMSAGVVPVRVRAGEGRAEPWEDLVAAEDDDESSPSLSPRLVSLPLVCSLRPTRTT